MSFLKEQLKMSGLINKFGQPLASGSLAEDDCTTSCQNGCATCNSGCSASCAPTNIGGC